MNKFLTLLCLLVGLTTLAHAEAPDVVIRQTAKEVLDTMKKDNDARTVRNDIEALALPRFDFRRMTALAVGRSWRNTTPAQQEALINEFQNLLVRTYAVTMLRFKNAQITVDATPQITPDGNEAIVKSSVQTGEASNSNKPVQIDYTLYKSGNTWKIFNVSLEGASLVTVYRGSFTDIINQSGIDGLIKSLKDKNDQLSAKNGA